LDNVKGKYILFCDADDTFEPDAAFECSAAMENNPVDIVIFNVNIIEADRIKLFFNDRGGESIFTARLEERRWLNQRECFKTAGAHLWRACFRSDLINRYNLRFFHYMTTEDFIFSLSYLMIVKSGYFLNKRLYTHYLNKDSLEDAVNKHPLLNRIKRVPILLWNTFIFAVKNKKPFKEIYVFYWLLYTYGVGLGCRYK
jgi:glycosyltransferase involved in cell wall biosynthesis